MATMRSSCCYCGTGCGRFGEVADYRKVFIATGVMLFAAWPDSQMYGTWFLAW